MFLERKTEFLVNIGKYIDQRDGKFAMFQRTDLSRAQSQPQPQTNNAMAQSAFGASHQL
jgi:hypothetical protein